MSKFLKFVVNVFLIFAIFAAAAILIPPLTGVTTTIVDTPTMNTNLPYGSITYSTEVSVSEVAVGDEVLKENNAATYAYEIISVEGSEGSYIVHDIYDAEAADEEIVLRNTVSKVAVIVPYLGYLIIAMHSIEGIIMVALVVVLMIILFILSELWKVEDEDEEEEDEESSSEPEKVDNEVKENIAADGSVLPVNEVTFEDDIPEIKPEFDFVSTSDLPEEADLETIMIDDDELELDEDLFLDSRDTATLNDLNPEGYGTLSSREEQVESSTSEDQTEPSIEEVQTESGVEEVPVVPMMEREEDEVAGEVTEADQDEQIAKLLRQEQEVRTEETDPSREDTKTIEETPAVEESSALEETPTEEITIDNTFDLSEAIFQATAEVEELEDRRQRSQTVKGKGDVTEVISHVPLETPAEEEQSQEDRFIPVERPSLDEMIQQAKAYGGKAKTVKDKATDVTVVDYSDIL